LIIMHSMAMHDALPANKKRTTGRRPSLADTLPEGQLVNRSWLKSRGFDRPLVDYYLRTGALQAVTRGVYRRPGPPLKWEHVVYSLQELDYDIHVGGRSALELQGLAHYVAKQRRFRIDLYSPVKLPSWVSKLDLPYQFVGHHLKLFEAMPEEALTTTPFGHWDWPIRYATWELAFLELLAKTESPAEFDYADKLFEGASVMRPWLIQKLLEACSNVKAKRLFLWFSRRHNHLWFAKLETRKIDLGRGKRMIVRGGALDTEYLITVPRDMIDDGEPIF